ncbi:hypothetical protein VTJ04DRAFT_10535 [Mycothermus thermophilus]|uniref:uncharacterized protein n=1 Tax=Humicola insolens TaxID=85995 RepID=UPI0037440034
MSGQRYTHGLYIDSGFCGTEWDWVARGLHLALFGILAFFGFTRVRLSSHFTSVLDVHHRPVASLDSADTENDLEPHCEEFGFFLCLDYCWLLSRRPTFSFFFTFFWNFSWALVVFL